MYPDEQPLAHHHAQPPTRAANRDRSQVTGETQPELLFVCAHCSNEMVYPLEWEEAAAGHWQMLLRCPDCEATREGVFPQSAVDVFADELDHGEAVLLCSLERVTRENMTEAIEHFIHALHADQILPVDF
jgi:hypothetical protein